MQGIAESTIGLAAVLGRHTVQHKDLARALSVTPETVSRWVGGQVTPGWKTIVRIISFLRRYEPDLRAEDLFARDGRAPREASKQRG